MDFVSIILTAAKTVKVSGALLLAICTHESNLKNVVVPHDGGSPSYGICQVKYDTAKMLGFTGQARDLLHPETNAFYAAKYLAYQQQRYGNCWVKLAASYNAGSYNPSNKAVGCPRNLKYVNRVKKKLEKHLQHRMICGK